MHKTKGEFHMPRPKRLRRVCFLPEYQHFGPLESGASPQEEISISLDEYEIIRLIDLEGQDQEQAALALDVSRGTVQRIYNEAKRKLAEFLVCGKKLTIAEGDIKLCDHPEHQGRRRCEMKGMKRCCEEDK
jgi:predicted DNA-binding protein (UPF0251 family)